MLYKYTFLVTYAVYVANISLCHVYSIIVYYSHILPLLFLLYVVSYTIIGDLSLPNLGLPSPQWQHLQHHIDIVIHNGAEVNWVKPYTLLKDVNVSSAVELLKLCLVNDATTTAITASTPGSTTKSATEECKEVEEEVENKKAKTLIFVSSIGAYDIKRGEGHEERLLTLGEGIGDMMGYGATKRMSEVSLLSLIFP